MQCSKCSSSLARKAADSHGKGNLERQTAKTKINDFNRKNFDFPSFWTIKRTVWWDWLP